MDITIPKGTKDLTPEEMITRQHVFLVLQGLFESYGYNPLETPCLERVDVLASKYTGGSEILKETFKLKDQGGRDLGLRYDLTVPLARYITMHPNVKLPFKRYQMGPVFRDGPIKAGRMRQFWQCDVDVVGTTSMIADAELLALTEQAFTTLGILVSIKVNNRKLLDGLLVEAGVPKSLLEVTILSIDKLAKIGEAGVKEELQRHQLTPAMMQRIFSLFSVTAKEPLAMLDELSGKLKDEQGKQGIHELRELFCFADFFGIKSLVLDVTLARGLAYYTSTVFEAFVPDGTFQSSLAGGGRYDEMIGNLLGTKQAYPAVGISFGIEPISLVMQQQHGIKKSVVQVYVIPIGTMAASVRIVQELRQQDIHVDIALGKKGVSRHLEYADSYQIPYVILVGEDELQKQKVKLRDMRTGKEQLLNVKDVVKLVTHTA
ncbi:histidine--tRNA ligase [Candidatus Woesearchaeota archaeon]|nr:histidine--tRNA ligase [Candidatus Woesearchaeota archaeon]